MWNLRATIPPLLGLFAAFLIAALPVAAPLAAQQRERILEFRSF